MKRWCRVYACSREAAEGSEFCRVKHGWQEIPVEEFAKPKPVLRTQWTPEQVVDAIQRWAAAHGRQPSRNDWARRGVDHPSAWTASKAFGTWGAALTASGFVPPIGRPPKVTV